MVCLCEAAAGQVVPVFLYSGRERTAKLLLENLRARCPDLVVAGCECPRDLPPRPPLVRNIIERLEASGAAIIFVGMDAFLFEVGTFGLPLAALGRADLERGDRI